MGRICRLGPFSADSVRQVRACRSGEGICKLGLCVCRLRRKTQYLQTRTHRLQIRTHRLQTNPSPLKTQPTYSANELNLQIRTTRSADSAVPRFTSLQIGHVCRLRVFVYRPGTSKQICRWAASADTHAEIGRVCRQHAGIVGE